MATFAQQLATQSWTLYGVGIFIIVSRTYARWRRVRSLSQFALDDWIMVTAVPLFYTGLVACLNIIASGGGSNLFPPDEFATFTPEDIVERIHGSKVVIISEQCMLNVIWTLKACMLLMYRRMAIGTTHFKWIRVVAVWTAIGWVAVQIAFFTTCRPFKGYWTVPPPNPQCSTLQHYAMVQACFNLSSDLLIIALPMPMVFGLALPLKQKIGLAALFGMGSFVIIAAILTKVYNLSDLYSTTYMFWYTRESSVAVYVANIPCIWPLLREHVSFLREKSNSFRTGVSNGPKYGGGSNYGHLSTKGSVIARSRVRSKQATASDEVELGRSFSKPGTLSHHSSDTTTNTLDGGLSPFPNAVHFGRPSQESDDRIIYEAIHGWKSPVPMEVQIDTKVEIQRNSWDNSRLEAGQGNIVKIEGPRSQSGG